MRLREYLVKEFGMKPDATDAEVYAKAASLMGEGKLTSEKFAELTKPETDDPAAKFLAGFDAILEKRLAAIAPKSEENATEKATEKAGEKTVTKTAEEIDAEVQRMVEQQLAKRLSPYGNGDRSSDPVLPEHVFGKGAPGTVNVKAASEFYDDTRSAVIMTKGHNAGKQAEFEGRPLNHSSQRDKARVGAWLRHKIGAKCGLSHLISDHDRDLYRELVEKGQWSGQIAGPNGEVTYKAQPLSELHKKTLLNDGTSGGSSLVPYVFDADIVTYLLLTNELFPLVDTRELARGSQVVGGALHHMTLASGPAEGGSPSIALQTTTNLVTNLTTNVHAVTGSVLIGKDFMADSPVDVVPMIMGDYQGQLGVWLDRAIAVGGGDGSQEPLGIFGAAGVPVVVSKNHSAGPWTATDTENMLEGLPKQYFQKPRTVFFGSNGLYFRIRGIAVSGTDQRRIYGYDYENYTLGSLPYKVQNNIGPAQLGLANMSYYRMWRRQGIEFDSTDRGVTLMQDNKMYIVVRSRWGGQLVNSEAAVICNDAAHS